MHNLDNQPRFIKIHIFNFLYLKDLLKLRLLSKYYSDLVRKNQWSHLIIKSKSDIYIKINIYYCINPTTNVIKLYKDQHLLLY